MGDTRSIGGRQFHFKVGMSALALILSACARTERIDLPEPPSGVSTALLVLLRSDQAPLLLLSRVGTRYSWPAAADTYDSAAVFYIPFTPEELGFDVKSETLVLPPAPDSPRGIPHFATGHRADLNTRPVAWSLLPPLSGLPSDLLAVRLPELTIQSCDALNGCLVDSETDLPERICRIPCAAPPVAPDPPALPVPALGPDLGPCPDGWGTRAFGRATVCSPPEPPELECEAGQIRWAGALECSRLSRACPTGSFTTELPPDRPLIYVDPSAAPGGSGTEQSPLASLDDALDRAPTDAVIVLSAGVHTRAGPLVDRQVDLVGACAARTRIEQDGDGYPLDVSGGRVALAGLTVGSEGGALRIRGAAEVRLDSVVLEGRDRAIFEVDGGATVTGEEVVVTGAPALPTPGPGEGLAVRGGAEVTLSHVMISRVAGVGVVALGASTVRLLALTVTRPQSHPMSGGGIWVSEGALLAVDGAELRGSFGAGARADQPGTRLVITDASILDTGPHAMIGGGFGVLASAGSTVTVSRSLIARQAVAMKVEDQASLTADQVELSSVPSEPGTIGAHAVRASLMLKRAYLVDPFVGVLAEGSTFEVRHVVVEGERPDPGAGLILRASARGTLSRMFVDLPGARGVVVSGSDTNVGAADLIVRDSGEASGGIGVTAEHHAVLTAERVEVQAAGSHGLAVTTTASAVITDLDVRGFLHEDGLPNANSQFGIYVWSGASLQLTRARVEDAPTGVIVAGTAHLEDLEIRLPRTWSNGVVATNSWGRGAPAVTRFTRVAVTGPPLDRNVNAPPNFFSKGAFHFDASPPEAMDHILIQNVEPVGIDLSLAALDGTLMLPAALLSVIRIDQVRGAGIVQDGRSSNVLVNNLEISQARATEPAVIRSNGRGIDLRGGHTRLDNFIVRDGSSVGIELSTRFGAEPRRLEFADGLVTGNEIGLVVPDVLRSMLSLLRVRITGNTVRDVANE